jgi:hypothetical protein
VAQRPGFKEGFAPGEAPPSTPTSPARRHSDWLSLCERIVLQKALPLFWKYGFARTTLPDLELATGVNQTADLVLESDALPNEFLAGDD